MVVDDYFSGRALLNQLPDIFWRKEYLTELGISGRMNKDKLIRKR